MQKMVLPKEELPRAAPLVLDKLEGIDCVGIEDFQCVFNPCLVDCEPRLVGLRRT